ncbi:MAG: TolC family protein [Gemmatimonadaceae bacterium]
MRQRAAEFRAQPTNIALANTGSGRGEGLSITYRRNEGARRCRGARSPITRTLALVCMLAAAAMPGRSDAQAPTAPLRLGELYDSARRSNPGVAAARALARAAQARVSAAKLPPDPEVELAFMNRELPGFSPMPGVGMTQLSVMQMLPVAGQLGLKGRIARSQVTAAEERAGEAEWETRAAVAMAFYDLYAADRQIAVTRESLRLLEDIRRTAESMYRVGEGRQADVLRAQVQMAREAEDTLRMVAMRDAMIARLGALLGDAGVESASAAEALRGRSPVLPLFPESIPALDSLDQRALSGRRMLKAGEAEVAAGATSLRLARREIWPDLRIGVAYAQGPSLAAMDEPTSTQRMGSLMLGASVPIFARGRQLAMREEAAAMEQMAVFDLAAMRADTRARVSAAHADLLRARSLQRLYRATILPQASATVQSSFAAYRVGGVDFMTLLDAQMLVTNYRRDLVMLEAEEGKAWAELEMLLSAELLDPYTTAPARSSGGV